MVTEEQKIRALAKSFYWQNLYRSSKDCGSIRLFDNATAYSSIQVSFLYWLRVYAMLYEELSNKEWDYLDEYMIKDDVRCDAFLHYREREITKKINKRHSEEKKSMRNAKPYEQEFKIYKGPVSKSVKSDN